MSANFVYDLATDSFSIKLRPFESVDNCIVNDDVVIDLGSDSEPVGYEIQHESRFADALGYLCATCGVIAIVSCRMQSAGPRICLRYKAHAAVHVTSARWLAIIKKISRGNAQIPTSPQNSPTMIESRLPTR